MTVATLIAVLKGCRQNANVVYPNMEIDQDEEVQKITEIDKGKYFPDEFRYYVRLR